MGARPSGAVGEYFRRYPSYKATSNTLMEGNFNYMNKWVFGHEAINKSYALGYVPGDHYSQKKSTVEDAHLGKRLMMDILHQLCHCLAPMSAVADKCYDPINHIIMSLLLLATVSCIGNIVAMLHPIQTMKFFQRTAKGDFMGGMRQRQPITGPMPREWCSTGMLPNAQLCLDVLLPAPRLLLARHVTNEWHYH
jgi:hypothetical protein